MTKRQLGAKPAQMTHADRLALIEKPIVLMNHRTIHPVKRWAGVFVDDYFGEKAGIRKVGGRLAGMTGNEPHLVGEPVTAYDSTFYLADMALWERICVEEV